MCARWDKAAWPQAPHGAFRLNIRKIYSLKGWLGTGTGYPEKRWSQHTGTYFNDM